MIETKSGRKSPATRVGLLLLLTALSSIPPYLFLNFFVGSRITFPERNLWNILLTYALNFALILPLMGRFLGIPLRTVWSDGKADWKNMGRYMPVSFFLTAVGFALASALLALFQALGQQSTNEVFEILGNSGSPFVITGWYLCVILIGPLYEEFLCRGLLLSALKPYGDFFAVLVSAVFFSIGHGNFSQMFVPLLLGLAYGYITLRTGNIKTAYSLHALNNALPIIPQALGGLTRTNFAFLTPLAYSALGAVGVFLLVKHRASVLAYLRPREEAPPEHSKIRFLFNPLILLWLLYCVFNLVLSVRPIT
ncbi:MAG TPA: type II CAAX endopeptidase family protein [Pseudoflavonifractor sp.]|nr:type II CAAX endopeptidase family protein [Pseudoflavonifractor sp.]